MTQVVSRVRPPPIEVDEKTMSILKAIGVEDKDVAAADKATILMALGRLLSINVKGAGKPSRYEVTKWVRDALELVMKSPPGDEAVILEAIYMDTPFESPTLIKAYRLLLWKLLAEFYEEVRELPLVWKRRKANLLVEDLYNIALESREFKDKIFSALETEKETNET